MKNMVFGNMVTIKHCGGGGGGGGGVSSERAHTLGPSANWWPIGSKFVCLSRGRGGGCVYVCERERESLYVVIHRFAKREI